MKKQIFKILFVIFFIILVILSLKVIVSLVLVGLLVGFWRNWQMGGDPRQATFLVGKAPSPALDGFYAGSVGRKTSWAGKKFDAVGAKGINVFGSEISGRMEKYPFITSTGKGLRDKNVDVLKVDYNIDGNPFWLRRILDEVVEVAPGEYLGKMQVKIIPGFPFTTLYFQLKK